MKSMWTSLRSSYEYLLNPIKALNLFIMVVSIKLKRLYLLIR